MAWRQIVRRRVRLIIRKRIDGQYYTCGNPFVLRPFLDWSNRAGLTHKRILEPFAGANSIVRKLQEINLCSRFSSFDISPADDAVEQRDTVASFPEGYEIAVTNPPWLARNSASRRCLPFIQTPYDDLYKHCLHLCLANCDYVAALLPASYLQSGLFQERLSVYILLHDKGMFNDTDNPVCLALFNRHASENIDIYYDNRHIGELHNLKEKMPNPVRNRSIRFNEPQGELGYIAFDNVQEPSIRFCPADELEDYRVGGSSRFITRIGGDLENVLIDDLNELIDRFRHETSDVFLTPFKGIRGDGQYRRRMNFAVARRLLNCA